MYIRLASLLMFQNHFIHPPPPIVKLPIVKEKFSKIVNKMFSTIVIIVGDKLNETSQVFTPAPMLQGHKYMTPYKTKLKTN